MLKCPLPIPQFSGSHCKFYICISLGTQLCLEFSLNLTYSISLELSNKTKNITLSFPMLNLKQIGGSKIKSFNKFFLKTNLPLILKIASSSPCLVLVLSSPSIFVLLLSYNRRLVLVSTSISSSCKRFVLIFSSLGFFNVFCSSPGRKTTS